VKLGFSRCLSERRAARSCNCAAMVFSLQQHSTLAGSIVSACSAYLRAAIVKHNAKGDSNAARDLIPLVYGELRRPAAQKMAREKPGLTIQPTLSFTRLTCRWSTTWASIRVPFLTIPEPHVATACLPKRA
jgi:hypothetical protein